MHSTIPAARFDIASFGELVSDPSRVAMLLSLMDGLARPASELASLAGVAPSTASSHLSRLLTGGLVLAEQRGRHRYFRLAGDHIADALEAITLHTAPGKRPHRPIRRARRSRAHAAATSTSPGSSASRGSRRSNLGVCCVSATALSRSPREGSPASKSWASRCARDASGQQGSRAWTGRSDETTSGGASAWCSRSTSSRSSGSRGGRGRARFGSPRMGGGGSGASGWKRRCWSERFAIRPPRC